MKQVQPRSIRQQRFKARNALGPLLFALVIAVVFVMSVPSGFTQDAKTGVIRLRVRVKIGDSTRGLARKRFFLIPGTLERNRALVDTIENRPVVSRDCYYTRLGASSALKNWLREGDCESIYCREISNDDVEGPKSVPEFVAALKEGEKEYSSRDIARKWLTTNVPDSLRDGFYKNRQSELKALISQAETSSRARITSVMTDRNGTAYFTDLIPGNYVVSSLVPAEIGDTSVIWNCELQVKPGDIATERPYLLSNRADRLVKCVGVEKPLPTCER